MRLQEKINIDLKQSMKNKETEKRDLLRVIIGEFTRGKLPKELSDEQVTKIIRKMKENAELYGNKDEVILLESYLPTQLGEKQIKTLISGIISKNGYDSMKSMGLIMKELKTSYGDQIDGKLASYIIKNILK